MSAESGPGPDGEPLLRRLLRRRAGEPEPSSAPASDPVPGSDIAPADAADTGAPPAAAPQKIDPATGKPIDELVDADLPPLESLGPDSDFSAFMGRRISPELRRQALRKLFQQPQFNRICLCAEYAENYNNFTPLGDIVPHDMARQIGVQAERLARKLLEDGGAQAGIDGAGDNGEAVAQRNIDADSTKVVGDAAESAGADVKAPSSNADKTID